jgi:hypothetical protein
MCPCTIVRLPVISIPHKGSSSYNGFITSALSEQKLRYIWERARHCTEHRYQECLTAGMSIGVQAIRALLAYARGREDIRALRTLLSCCMMYASSAAVCTPKSDFTQTRLVQSVPPC